MNFENISPILDNISFNLWGAELDVYYKWSCDIDGSGSDVDTLEVYHEFVDIKQMLNEEVLEEVEKRIKEDVNKKLAEYDLTL